jgi:hypothetical protein
LPAEVIPPDQEVSGTKGPLAAVSSKDAPRFDVYYPGAKKKKDDECE